MSRPLTTIMTTSFFVASYSLSLEADLQAENNPITSIRLAVDAVDAAAAGVIDGVCYRNTEYAGEA